MVELAQCQLRSRAKLAARLRQPHPISAAVEKCEPEQLLEACNSGEDGWMRSVQGKGGRLEAALACHGVKAP